MVLQLEDSRGLITFGLRREVLENQLAEPSEMLDGIEAVTAADVQRVAEQIMVQRQPQLRLGRPVRRREPVPGASGGVTETCRPTDYDALFAPPPGATPGRFCPRTRGSGMPIPISAWMRTASRRSPEELLAVMDAERVDRAFTFPLNDPERVPNYRVPNDRVLDWCAAAPERLVPFCRLDLSDDPIGEATRCLDRGARGIKLHPRAQKFDFGARGLDPVFSLAAERSVPILIHAGRGLPRDRRRPAATGRAPPAARS